MTFSTSLKNIHRLRLAEYWIKREVTGITDKFLDANFLQELEADGRKRNKAIRDLAVEGYLDYLDGKVFLNKKAYNEVVEERPNLVGSIIPPFQIPHGVAWNILSLEWQKFVLEHKEEYTLCYEDMYSHKALPIGFGGALLSEVKYHKLLVKDSAFEEAREKASFERSLRYMRKHDVPWGLEHLGIANNSETECLNFDSFGSNVLKDDPENWESDLEANIEKAQEELKKYQQRLNNLIGLKTKMAEYGGWNKFLADYDLILIEKLNEQNTRNS